VVDKCCLQLSVTHAVDALFIFLFETWDHVVYTSKVAVLLLWMVRGEFKMSCSLSLHMFQSVWHPVCHVKIKLEMVVHTI